MTQPSLTCAQIITNFELQVNDITELSSSEELALLNRVYQKICLDKPWEFLKVPATGSILSDATSSYITVPADFAFFVSNNTYTDNSIGVTNNAAPKVIFVISSGQYQPYQIVNFSDRRQYLNRQGFAYLDVANNIIRFTGTPNGTTYEFDYIKVPAVLLIGDSPIFPGRFHDILTFAMATDNEILQLSPKATSYMAENSAKYQGYFLDMVWWNSQLNMN